MAVPDSAWPHARVAVYCDGLAVHGNRNSLEKGARKRHYLQERGWVVLTYWRRTIVRNPPACARQIAEVVRQRIV